MNNETANEPRLDTVLEEAEGSEDLNCHPCRVAAGMGITLDLCNQFKLDCHQLESILDHPEQFGIAEAQAAIEEIAQNTDHEKAKRLLDYTLCLIKGKCRLD